MDLSLRVHHRLKAISIIRNFVIECAIYYGADSKESFELGLAAEEAAEHIIRSYPAAEAESPFNITCTDKDDMLRFIFSNTGLPVDVESIPQYDVNNPEASIDGLSFFLMEKLTDNFQFENRGTEGWQTVIDKKLKSLKKPGVEKSGGDDAPQLPPPGKLSLSIAVPEDAYEITKLAYYTYRYSYAKRAFYYPEVLKEALTNQQIISFIVKNEYGEVIAHSALLRSDNCSEIAEAGAIMAMPEYRRSTAVLRLVKDTNHFLKGPDNPGIHILESNLVTAHTGSQRICRSFKFIPLALKISVHDRAMFIDVDDVASERETLLYSILTYRILEQFDLYAPNEHRKIIHKMLKEVNLNFTPVDDSAGDNLPANTELMVQRMEQQQFARIIVRETGKDLFREVKKLSYQLSLDDILTVSLKIPLSAPLPDDLDEQLNAMNFFFSGIVPSTPAKWQILYTCLHHHQIHFDQIRLADERAVELRDYVQKCYEKVIP